MQLGIDPELHQQVLCDIGFFSIHEINNMLVYPEVLYNEFWDVLKKDDNNIWRHRPTKGFGIK